MQGYLVDKIIQMIPSALEDFREVWGAVVEGTKRQIYRNRQAIRSAKLSVEHEAAVKAALAARTDFRKTARLLGIGMLSSPGRGDA